MDSVHLETATHDGNRCYQYRGKWFSLDSRADEPTTRRIAVRLEQVFTAYRQLIPPRIDAPRPLRLVVFASMSEYKAYLERLGIALENPACFIPRENMVVAGSDTARVSAELSKVNLRHTQLQAELDRLEKQMPGQLAGAAKQMRQTQPGSTPHDQIAKALLSQRRGLEEEIRKKRAELQRIERENDRTFQHVAGQMFTRIYHEALHAYLENYVYPHAQHNVPLWLDEGLAQVFEVGWLESGSFRGDSANADALKLLKADLASQQPLGLEKVLSAGQPEFLASGDAERYYAYSWGLAYYLELENHVLPSAALDQYVAPVPQRADPVAGFEKLIGMPLEKFAPAWREYMLRLR